MWRSALSGLLGRLNHLRPQPRRSYDLDLVDQWLVLTLHRFNGCGYRHLEQELLAIRGAPPAEVVASILKLEEAGLLDRTPAQALVAEERRFRLTRQGRRLAGYLPAAPRSPTAFYF
jgi:hypothetical protein